MKSQLTFLISGVILGLSGGLTPGPLLTLIISETLKHGIKEGIKISLAPLLTDLPIVLVAVYALSRLTDIGPLLGIIAICGAAFLAYLGYESLSFKGTDLAVDQVRPQSLKKGVIANFLNPSPYLFWFSIGAPIILKAFRISLSSAILFVFGFYLLLIGSKIVMAVLTGKSRQFLKSGRYVYTIRFLGILLLVFALLFLWDGLLYLEVF